jgi:hypothetical protein
MAAPDSLSRMLTDILVDGEGARLYLLVTGLGLIVGGVAGATGKTTGRGAVVGMALSALCAAALVAQFALIGAARVLTEFSMDLAAILLGTVALLVSGAVAGAIGVAIGKGARPQTRSSSD